MRHECLVSPKDLGPFLLGQLDPHEEVRIGELVDTCPSCSEEARQLRPVVSALGRASAPTATAGVPRPRPPAGPPAGVDRLLASIGRERAGRRWRSWRVPAAAAAVVVALTLGGVVVATRGGDDVGRQVVLAGQGSAVGTAVVTKRPWGTAIVLTVRGLQPDKPYGAWLETRSGDRVPAGTFTPASGGSLRLDLSALLPIGDAAAVGVTQLGGEDVLRHDF